MLNVFLLFASIFLRLLFFLAGLIPQLLQKSRTFYPCLMNMKTSKTKSVNANIEVRVKSATGTTYRALVEKRNKKVTYLCERQRGVFTKDCKIARALTELLLSGEYELPYAKHRKMVERLFKVSLNAPEPQSRCRVTNEVLQPENATPPWLMDDEEPQPESETRSDAEIEAALWREVEEEREAALRAESQPAPEASEEPEVKLATHNLKRAGQAPKSINPESKDIKPEPGDQLIRLYKGKLIEVDVLDSGYGWNGEIYPTLTHISWKVTGYQIGGNNFFGLPVQHRSN